MFGFGKKKFSVEQAQDIIQGSILAYSTIRPEASYLWEKVFNLNDTPLNFDDLKFVKVHVLFKSQVVFSAIAKNNDIDIYVDIRERIMKWVADTYKVEFDEDTEFSWFNRFKTSFAEHPDVQSMIISLGLDYDLSLTEGKIRLNPIATQAIYQSIEHHLYETNKAIGKMKIVS